MIAPLTKYEGWLVPVSGGISISGMTCQPSPPRPKHYTFPQQWGQAAREEGAAPGKYWVLIYSTEQRVVILQY